MWDIYSTDVDYETGIGHGLYILAECEAQHASSDPYSSDTEFDELLKFRLLGNMFFTKLGFTRKHPNMYLILAKYPNRLQ